MKQVGMTMHGHSQYADRLWALLGQHEPSTSAPGQGSQSPLDGVDYLALVPYMLLAGASARTEPMISEPPIDRPAFVHYIEVPDDDEERFYADLEELLERAANGRR